MGSVETFDPKAPLRVSDAARTHFVERLRLRPSAKGVRVDIKKSGCSGYQYVIDYVDGILETDNTVPLDDHYVLCINPTAIPVIGGTLIDFVKEGLNETIEFENPNVQSRCGCGESFSVAAQPTREND